MAGYIHDPLQIINLIADNLRDRYKSGFPVLKEIIQNADDAGSTDDPIQLEFGLSRGISNAEHPLLKGPALYFLNNGAFADTDYKAILSFGLNRKAIEQSSIGKFGLGMKSVFHFCEAFFFLAQNKDRDYTEILNPWSGGDLSSFQDHNDWDNFSTSDAGLIRDHVQPVMEEMDLKGSSFLLWLPLRQKKHLLVNGKEVGSIISEFPGDNDHLLSFLDQQELAQKIASLLPLLRRINSIRFWHANGDATVASPRFQVSMKGASRIGFANGEYQSKDLEGVVHYQYNGMEDNLYALTYSGQEKLLEIPELLSLRESPLWPKSYVRDDLGKSQEAPDKARGHGAVIFSRSNEKEQGRLKIRWAVFLPVDAAKEEVACAGESCYRITLHGYFFVDAGRVDIEGLQDGADQVDLTAVPQNEVELRRVWNIRLARQGTLPLVLPALEAFIAKARLSADDIWNLSEGIEKSKLFKRHKESICASSSWTCCLNQKGREWCILPGDQENLPLPGPPLSAPERPWKTLPKLELLQERGIALLLKDAPHLLARSLPQWNEANLLEVLSLPEKKVFTDQGCLDYLLQFMADPSIKPFLTVGSLQQRLRQIANHAFIALGTDLRQHRKKVQEFVSFILPESRFALKPDAPQVIRELQQCKTGVLILANEFDSHDSAGNARLTIEDAFTLLEKLHDLITRYEHRNEQEIIKHCRTIAKEILQGQNEEQRRTLLVQADGLKILEGVDCIKRKVVALSPADLKDRYDNQLLFLYSQGTTSSQRLGLALSLQKAVREPVVLTSRETIKFVFGENCKLTPCTADGVLDSLGSEILPLQTIDNRRQLLPDVAGADLDLPRRVRGLRYLLHGLEEYFDDDETLWVSGYDQSPVWGKLWQQLESHHEDGWNLLDRKLVEEIPPNKWPKLAIREIKPDGILEELRIKGPGSITGDLFIPDERDAVLRELVSDEELWKNLPFHETVMGNLVSISAEKSYLESSILLPDELHNSADIIKSSNDSAIRRQQKEWLTPLSKEGVIRIVMQHEEPAKFWRLVMDNLEAGTSLIRSPLLRDTPWLPDSNLVSVKPSDVLCLENMQDEVDRLLVVARGAFWSPGKLLDDLQQHQSFALLKEHSFAIGQEGFEKLALLLGETSEYHVGTIIYQEDDFDRIVRICARFPVHLSLPGWVLLSCALDNSKEMAKEFLLTEIMQPIEGERIVAILNWLQEEHVKVGKGVKKDLLASFNSYLAALVNIEGGTDIISRLSLLNRDGDWKPAKELCSEAEGVADSHLLDDEQKRILRNIIFHADRQQATEDEKIPSKRDLQPEITASADQLETFFSEWEGLVAPEIICAFLSLLGDDPKMLALAERYRGRHSVNWVRDNIPWQIHHRNDELNRQEWLYGLNQHQAMAQHRFIIRCSDGDMVQTCSILGGEIEVPLKSRFSTLITGGLFYEYPDGQINNVRISLRRPCVEDLSPTELSGVLKASAEYLLKKAFNQRDYDLGRLWEELDRSEQLDIRIAQQLVLNHIPFYLRQMGWHKHPILQNLLNQWDDACRNKEEYYETKDKRDIYDGEIRDVLKKIQELLKTDEDVQAAVLNAVRTKIVDFQYSTASIPFELFQNADDAVVELAMMKAYPKTPAEMGDEILPDHVRRFLIIEQDNSLLIAHWGRPVNEFGSAGFPGRERGFHQDLEKMLVLSSSDKSEEGKVTGKFGLGFKSVLLASERPRLLSGRLATEIIAGLCPILLKDSAQLRSKLHELSPDRRWQGTLLELPLKDSTPQEIMSPFSQLAGVMTIFSKQIRRIDIHGNTNQAWEWAPEKISLADDACLELGQLPMPEGLHQSGFAVYFKLHDGGILLAVGPEGFRVLPVELPAIWVVAPTRESEGLGFAVNCMFDLDAGRARLAGNSNVNKQKAQNLGRSFGQALRKLYGMSLVQWDDLKANFRFEEDLTTYDFWATLWKVIGEGIQARGSEEVSNLVSQLFCGDNGLGYLISHEDAMPNGLWNNYRTLTRPDKIQVVLKGNLGNAFIFKELVEWEFFRNFLGAPESVTTDAVYTVARKVFPALGQAKSQWRSVQLADVLRSFSETEKEISPDTAVILGRLLNHDALKHEDFEKEKELIGQALHSFLFKTQDASFHSADEILVLQKHSQANPDEAKRAAFAPENHILFREYQGTGLDFFFSCREKISIPLEKMAQWVIDAEGNEKKEKALLYLLEGEHGEKVAHLLRENGINGTWLRELRPNSLIFTGWKDDDITELLLRKLPSTVELLDSNRGWDEEADMDDIPAPLDPGLALNKIWDWWATNKNDLLKRYYDHTFPMGAIPSLQVDDVGQTNRSSWLILFVLAHLHTMGRQQNYHHRSFIELCMSKGWWQTFAAKNPQGRSDEWMKVLDEYIDEQIDSSSYEHWMNRFPAIYRIARGIDDYTELLLSLDRYTGKDNIGKLLQPSANSQYQGGGISAPPINKTLGYGICFAIRELSRCGVLKNEHVTPYCYVPVKRVRGLCLLLDNKEVGDVPFESSRLIHQMLCQYLGPEKATFEGCFDIPLQILSEDKDLLQEMLK
ncbi:MAG: hypothetical protein KKG35_03020 [Proteobacteria bacterium]|nr:hypothetical protein [Pseudomonadota bacterium]